MNSPVRLNSIFIDKIRNFKKFEMLFNLDTNIIVGPNGSGKTTIMTIINLIFQEQSFRIETQLKENFTIFVGLEPVKLTQKNIEFYGLSGKFNKYNNEFTDKYELMEKIMKSYIGKSDPSLLEEEINIETLKNKSCDFYLGIIRDDTANNYVSTAQILFIICEGTIYKWVDFKRDEFIKKYENQIISFNLGANDDVQTYISLLEKEKKMQDKIEQMKIDASKTINKLTNTKDFSVIYESVQMSNLQITNSSGKNIEYLSSGEQQIAKLEILNTTVKIKRPTIVLFDEPEIHLNQGQLPLLSDLLNELSKLDIQIIAASHSEHFVRNSNFRSLKYIKFDTNRNPHQIDIPQDSELLLQYPQIFFAEGLILVEAFADAIFYKKSIDIILRRRKVKDTSILNYYVIPTFSKFKIKKLSTFIQQKLDIPLLTIADFDFLLEETCYDNLSRKDIDEILKLKSEFVELDEVSSIKAFRKLKIDTANEFIMFLDMIFTKTESINQKEKIRYSNFRTLFDVHRYDYKKVKNLKKLREIFLQNKIWLLSKPKLEFLVVDQLKSSSKVSAEKLIDEFYPKDFKELKAYIKDNDALNELIKIADYIERKMIIN